ncbi:MAG: nucleotidyltransferase family protein [Synechocystis sp.]|jgi:hypothetical protein
MFDTSLLDQVLQQKHQQLEQERQNLIQKTNHWLDQWGQKYGITKAYLFGSVTQPSRFRSGSDVDLALETVAPEVIFAIIAELSTALEREVDVIELSKCHFAEKIRRSGMPWTPNN